VKVLYILVYSNPLKRKLQNDSTRAEEMEEVPWH